PLLDYIQRFGPEYIAKHILVYANKSQEDILFGKELRKMLGANFISRLSRPKTITVPPERVDLGFLKSIVQRKEQYFYICGPKSFEFDIMSHLINMGVNPIRIQTGYSFGQIEKMKFQKIHGFRQKQL